MVTTIRNMCQFKEKYLPMMAEADKALTMSKPEFWLWYLAFPKEKRERIKKALLSLANEHQRKAWHIYDLLCH